LRRAGELPAALGGGGEESTALAVPSHEFELLHVAGARVVTLQLGKKKVEALIRDIQYDPLGEYVMHVDFDRVVAGQTVEVQVRLETFGEAAGVAAGGVLQTRIESVTVACLPGVIPEHIEVDVQALEVGDGIRAGELVLPEGVTLVSDPADLCLAVTAAEAPPEEEEEEVEAPVEEEEGEPEVIGKKKEEEQEEAKD
ncbi:MAG: 50S ribosomal protein L25, partial [Planctomycetota bacterium]